ncbi:MAGa3780 family membrane protein [Mycoplasmopsis primatum]|uniref:MAGa3780 family membrane protein n=1 Tax=Mycoplasmopsis primatum TaxID=55604 RepID=UPI0004953B65|nr:hypothetical protein [Mycoplasmopsis primatum]
MENKELAKKQCKFAQTFKNWNLTYKLVFIFGLIILLADFIILIHSFKYHGIGPLKKIYNRPEFKEAIDKGTIVFNNVVYPNALQAIWSQTMTFTMISNWMLAITMVVLPFKKDNQKTQAWFMATVVYISITFLIYWTLIFFVSLKKGIWNDLKSALPSFILHAINPLFGIVALILLRKQISISNKQIWMMSLVISGYFLFGFITFFIGDQLVDDKSNAKLYSKYNIVIYTFLNFRHPFFYKGGNVAIVVILDLLALSVGILIAPTIGFIWKYSLKIKNPEIKQNINQKLSEAVSQTIYEN